MADRSGERAVVSRYAGKKERAGVLYRILRLYIENREREQPAEAAETGGGDENSEPDA